MGAFYKKILKMLIMLGVSFIVISCASSPAGTPEYSPDVQRSESAADDRMIAYTILLELSSKNVEEGRNILIEQVNHHQGFIIRGTGNTITTRIPSENMEDFITVAKTLGKINNERRTGTDITDQYRDNTIRLDSLRNVRDRYLALLDRANTVSDMLIIERELERINTEIELIQGSIRQAELSVSYSIITVRFNDRVRPGPLGWVFYGLYHGIRWLFVWR